MINSVNLSEANETYLNRLKIEQSNLHKTTQPEVKNNKKGENKIKPFSGAMSLLTGTYTLSKAITSGLRRVLGIELETHTTSGNNAKKIIKNGCVLDPKFGGSASAKINPNFVENSRNSVHITGWHKKQDISRFNKMFEQFSSGSIKAEKIDEILSSPLRTPIKWMYKKMQKLQYKFTSFMGADIKSQGLLERVKDLLPKTFYIGGTDKYFNDNFTPDIDDIALKTNKPIKVFKTKIGAIVDALKRDGLSGIKQNKTRVAIGIIITAACATITYKLIKGGLEKLGIIKKEEKANSNV